MPAHHAVLGNPITPPWPTGFQEAVFGMGCFWGAERLFWETPGVWTTAVGYAGGYTPNPTYEEVCSGSTGHTEVVRVVWDPAVAHLRADVLQVFWEGHDPTQGMRQGNDVGTQYRSAIYTSDEEQAAAAEASRRAYERAPARGRPRRDHDGDRARRRLLLRRGLPPAVPAQGPERLLRPRRHRRLVPGGPDDRLAASRGPCRRCGVPLAIAVAGADPHRASATRTRSRMGVLLVGVAAARGAAERDRAGRRAVERGARRGGARPRVLRLVTDAGRE